MKVLNLQCELGHSFEGWFSDEADYEQQTARQLLHCPLCDSGSITKLPSAPRLNLGASQPEQTPAQAKQELMNMPQDQMQRMIMEAARKLMNETKDVGERFAEEARRIHYGEVKAEAIRGRATREEAQALHDEGIAFMAMPIPSLLKEPLQ
jgi:hypothetical protein